MPMTIDFSGKNVLVVGGGRGIGKEIALTFAECGANVVIGDYNAENGEAAAQEIGALGVTGLFYPCNVAKREDVDALVAHAAELDGGLDVIVNTAGVTSSQDTINISDEEFHRIININLLGAANVFRAGLNYMMPRKKGNMIVLSSVAGRTGSRTMTIYTASKAGTISLTQAAAKTGAPCGVRVNSIAPGYVRTRSGIQFLTAFPAAFPANALRTIPMPSAIRTMPTRSKMRCRLVVPRPAEILHGQLCFWPLTMHRISPVRRLPSMAARRWFEHAGKEKLCR